MPKNAYYFPHDYNARNDRKLQRVLVEMGVAGIGAYWCIIEMLYEEGGSIPVDDIPVIAKSLRMQTRTLEKLLKNFDLFNFSDDVFSSFAVVCRQKKINAKSETYRKNALARWEKDAIASKTLCKTDALKEKEIKEKEIKEKEIKEKETTTTTTIFSVWEDCIGRPITGWEGEQLSSLSDDFRDEDISDAIKEAAGNDRTKVNIKYITAILERWQKDGKHSKSKSDDNQKDISPEDYISKYAHLTKERGK